VRYKWKLIKYGVPVILDVHDLEVLNGVVQEKNGIVRTEKNVKKLETEEETNKEPIKLENSGGI